MCFSCGFGLCLSLQNCVQTCEFDEPKIPVTCLKGGGNKWNSQTINGSTCVSPCKWVDVCHPLRKCTNLNICCFYTRSDDSVMVWDILSAVKEKS